MAEESIRLINELKQKVALAKQNKEKAQLKAESEEYFKKLLEDKEAEIWKKVEGRKATSEKFEYGEDEPYDGETEPIRKMIDTPADKQENKELAQRVQKFNDTVVAVAAITKKHPSQLNIWSQFKQGRTELQKALDTATSGQGSDWMPTQYSAEFIERMEDDYKVAQWFRSIPMPRGVDKLRIPGAGTAASVYLLSNSSDDDVDKIAATTPGTRYVELDPVKLGSRVEVETDMDEDSAVAVADYVNERLRIAAARAIDDAIINGDTSSTHQDSDVTSSADPRKAWNGLRDMTAAAWKIDSSNNVNVANFRKTWAQMSDALSDYGDPEDLVIFCNSIGYLRLMVISETLTRDKRGEKATVDTGRLDELFGIPIQVTSRIRRDLNASGVYDGTTTNSTLIQFANHRAFVMGDKRQVTVKSDENITTDRMRYVVTTRKIFKNLYVEQTDRVTAQLYNITITT